MLGDEADTHTHSFPAFYLITIWPHKAAFLVRRKLQCWGNSGKGADQKAAPGDSIVEHSGVESNWKEQKTETRDMEMDLSREREMIVCRWKGVFPLHFTRKTVILHPNLSPTLSLYLAIEFSQLAPYRTIGRHVNATFFLAETHFRYCQNRKKGTRLGRTRIVVSY